MELCVGRELKRSGFEPNSLNLTSFFVHLDSFDNIHVSLTFIFNVLSDYPFLGEPNRCSAIEKKNLRDKAMNSTILRKSQFICLFHHHLFISLQIYGYSAFLQCYIEKTTSIILHMTIELYGQFMEPVIYILEQVTISNKINGRYLNAFLGG